MTMSSEWSRWAHHPELVKFYESHRHRPEDLYDSERRFLPWLAGQAESVLDVGCATGGFLNIWRQFRPGIDYRGVDVSPQLVEAARRLHPGVEFILGDCAAGLPLESRLADVVQALGWLHWEPRYRDAIAELWRLTRRFLFFDVRLADEPSDLDAGVQRLAFTEPWDGKTTTPYICASWPRFAAFLRDLSPATVLGYGYWGRPAATVDGVDRPLCFATFVLERRTVVSEEITVSLGLPLLWPRTACEGVRILPPAWLDEQVPRTEEANPQWPSSRCC